MKDFDNFKNYFEHKFKKKGEKLLRKIIKLTPIKENKIKVFYHLLVNRIKVLD
jgi:hypothetical protein